VGRPRSQERVDRAGRSRPADPPSDGRRRGRRYNRSILPLAAVPTRCASFRLLTLVCRYGMLFGSDCNNNILWDVTGGQKRRYSRYKTLEGIYDLQVWGTDEKPSRRAMHEAVFEAGWDADALLPLHRQVVAPAHRGRGREVLSLDWTYAHHERGPKIWGVKKAWDHVARRMAPYQTLVTAVIANRERLDGIEVVVQQPDRHEEEIAYLQETVQESYAQMEAARGRVLELFHHLLHRLGYKKRTEIALEVVQQLEQEGHFPQAHY